MFLMKREHWVQGLGTAVSLGLSPGSTPQSGVGRTTRGRKERGGEGWHGKGNFATLASVWPLRTAVVKQEGKEQDITFKRMV